MRFAAPGMPAVASTSATGVMVRCGGGGNYLDGKQLSHFLKGTQCVEESDSTEIEILKYYLNKSLVLREMLSK